MELEEVCGGVGPVAAAGLRPGGVVVLVGVEQVSERARDHQARVVVVAGASVFVFFVVAACR